MEANGSGGARAAAPAALQARYSVALVPDATQPNYKTPLKELYDRHHIPGLDYHTTPLARASSSDSVQYQSLLTCPAISGQDSSGKTVVGLHQCEFHGYGRTKKDAEMQCAYQALDFISKQAPGLGVPSPPPLDNPSHPLPSTATTGTTSSSAMSASGHSSSMTGVEAPPAVTPAGGDDGGSAGAGIAGAEGHQAQAAGSGSAQADLSSGPGQSAEVPPDSIDSMPVQQLRAELRASREREAHMRDVLLGFRDAANAVLGAQQQGG